MTEFREESALTTSFAGVIGDGSPLSLLSGTSMAFIASIVSGSSKESLLGAGVRLELEPFAIFVTEADPALLSERIVLP